MKIDFYINPIKKENFLEGVIKISNKLITNLRTTAYDLRAKKGIAALPTMLLIGGLVAEIIIGVTATSYVFVQSEFGYRLSSEAFMAAKAGIEDAVMKIVLNKNFTTSPYTLTVGNYSADVAVCNDPPCIAAGKFKITSLGKAQSRRRNLRAVLNVDSATGEVRLESLKEVQL